MAEGKKVGSIYIDLGMKADTFSRGMTKAENAIRGFGSKVKSTLTAIKNFIFSWKTLVIGAMVAAFAGAGIKKAIGGLKTLVRGVIEASSTYEQLRMTLKVLLKDQDKANKAFDEARELAASTAFSIEEITRGYIQMLTFGFEQSKIPETLLLAADAATAFGQNLDEVIRSLNYLKAGRKGEALESLARFGIARPELIKRGATFSAGGELETSTEETLRIIYEIWKEKVGGMSKEGTKTWEGMISNFKDAWVDFKAMIGEAGFFDSVKNALKFILDKINEWSESGQLKKWADDISGYLTKSFNSLLLVMSKIFGFKLETPKKLAPEISNKNIVDLESDYAQLTQLYKENNMELTLSLEKYKEIYGATKDMTESTGKLMTLEDGYNQMKRVYADNNLELALSLEKYKEIYGETAEEVKKGDIVPKGNEVFDWAQKIADSMGEGTVGEKITNGITAAFDQINWAKIADGIVSSIPAFAAAGAKIGRALGEAISTSIQNEWPLVYWLWKASTGAIELTFLPLGGISSGIESMVNGSNLRKQGAGTPYNGEW